jgi:hypothetical protein
LGLQQVLVLQFDGFVEFQELVLSKKASEITQHNNHPAGTCKHPNHQHLRRNEKLILRTRRTNTSSTRALIYGPISISNFLCHSNMRGHIIEEDDERNQPRKYLSVQYLIIEPFQPVFLRSQAQGLNIEQVFV